MAINTIKAWWISNNLWCLPLSFLLSCLIQLTWAMIRFRPFNLQTYRSDQKILSIFFIIRLINCMYLRGFFPFSKRKKTLQWLINCWILKCIYRIKYIEIFNEEMIKRHSVGKAHLETFIYFVACFINSNKELKKHLNWILWSKLTQ